MTTYYEMLGIAKDASRNEIKRAYFTLVKKYSPEKNPEEFKQIRKAYETLYDTSARAAYDGMISLPEEYEEIYISGRKLIEDNYYDDNVVAKLKKAVKEKPDMYALSDVLGQIYLDNDKSGNAVKIYEQLTSQQPQNINYRIKLAESYLKRGFHKKSLAEYQNLIHANRDNAVLWSGMCSAYIDAKDFKSAEQILSEGFKAVEESNGDTIELNIAAVRLYMCDEKNHDKLQKNIDILSERFQQDPALKPILLSGFKNIMSPKTSKSMIANAESVQKNIMVILKFMLTIKPDDNLKKLFDLLSDSSIMSKMESDENVPKFAFIITDIKQNAEDDEPEAKVALAVWEAECLFDIETSRKQLRYFREHYPEQYALHKSFYDRVLDRKQESRLSREMHNKLKTLNKKYPDVFHVMTGGDSYEDKDDEYFAPSVPFSYDTPKVGRNDPCPCGSGKKYKKCCGA